MTFLKHATVCENWRLFMSKWITSKLTEQYTNNRHLNEAILCQDWMKSSIYRTATTFGNEGAPIILQLVCRIWDWFWVCEWRISIRRSWAFNIIDDVLKWIKTHYYCKRKCCKMYEFIALWIFNNVDKFILSSVNLQWNRKFLCITIGR